MIAVGTTLSGGPRTDPRPRIPLADRPLDPADRAGADYLTNKAPYLDYADRHGVIEGACRHFVKGRIDVTGARWGLDGAEAVLRLRALVLNGDFDDYWRFHLSREQDRAHLARYAPDVLTMDASHPLRGAAPSRFEFGDHYNRARPHQGIDHRLPLPSADEAGIPVGRVERHDRLGGLIHEYLRAA